jgi:hypothetical protein
MPVRHGPTPLPTEMDTELPLKGRASTAAVAHTIIAVNSREALTGRVRDSKGKMSFMLAKPAQ